MTGESVHARVVPIDTPPMGDLTDAEFRRLKHKRWLAGMGLPDVLTSWDLSEMEFAPPVWIVDGIVPEGLTMLAGAPKTGKSWFVLSVAVAVSTGGYVLGSIKTEKRLVLYLALEDNPRRLKRRLDSIGALPSHDLHLATEWKAGKEGKEQLCAWLEHYDDTGLVIIDTLAQFRGISAGNVGAYEADYRDISDLKKIGERFDASIIASHHTRKMAAEDPFAMVSGTFGLTGAADTTLVLTRSRKEADAELYVDGRDIEEVKELALKMDTDVGGWTLLGDAAEYRQSKERRSILDLLREAGEPMTGPDIAGALSKNLGTTKVLLRRLVRNGTVSNIRGKGYVLNTVPG